MHENKMKLRTAKQSDATQIADIYNQAIIDGLETAEIDPVSIENRIDWLDQHNEKTHPVLVVEIDGTIVGFGSISPYRKGRGALKATVEISYYVRDTFRRCGVGTKIIEELIIFSKNCGIKNLFAIVIEANINSIAILEKFNFKKWGTMPGVVEYHGREYDHLYYGLRI